MSVKGFWGIFSGFLALSEQEKYCILGACFYFNNF